MKCELIPSLIVPVACFLLAVIPGRAQQALPDSAAVVDSARVAVAWLCSPEFAGRGYLRDGHAKAAAYILDKFRSLGLDDATTQRFEFSTRVFTAVPRLSLNGKPMLLGKDFLPYPSTGSGRKAGLRNIETVDSTTTLSHSRSRFRNPVIIFNEKLAGKFLAGINSALKLIRVERLTGDPGSDSTNVPVLCVLQSSLPDTIREVSFSVQAETRQVRTVNVIGRIPGTAVPDSTIILCAHYDHLGAMGDSAYFPGANDNASGTAMLFAMARAIKSHPLRYTVVLIAFSGEEAGLLGSHYYVGHPLYNLDRVRFVLNMDMTASGRDGIMACGGSDFPAEFALLQSVNDSLRLGDLRKRAGAPNSDQYYFVKYGVNGFYVYPFVGYQPYHSVYDLPETLQWDVFYKMYRLFHGFARRL